ncbi:hypothetical protein EHEL_081210 [Encephalitozoon hellem ATCC 50504]|uniref:DUF5101 domain-containing protein n=1 Tax=Encephalitozoon hellem TaxID=27973 RepID=A0A9Q9C445_ENCHE|nr:uncharacterized protein EHEL_081210 [Encephalitozoon hellem ATCC 50504]AFM98821.1 hypothetical protein EHEL_081210 [Encephalitozoon hellem ATCC 50504]UTX43799.1 DUF5101 domain-containing protein [Encephalitozoon hellem]WEL39278.1 DUF5101 domain-containing protein [Encephalitozoon hellem]|eukprot:XP_003887802.1 hypothetical protein EHEL_081210 [Encephalitozoon hellem ATCC 50504]
MRPVLNETTNATKRLESKGKEAGGDKERVLCFLRDAYKKTRDHSLKYDLKKCLEIIEGKENQEVADLRNALEEALVENETLFAEKCELAVTLECMKAERGE